MTSLDKLLKDFEQQAGLTHDEAREFVERANVPLDRIDLIREYLQRELGIFLPSDTMQPKKALPSLSRLPAGLWDDAERASSGAVVQLQKVGKSAGDKLLFEDLELVVLRGEKSLLVGRNGSGKSSLLRIIAGVDEEYDGKVVKLKGVDVMLIDQDLCLSGMSSATVEEALAHLMGEKGRIIADNRKYENLANEGGLQGDAMDAYMKCIEDMNERDLYFIAGIQEEVLRHFGLAEGDLKREVGSLSGGERLRLAFAAALLRRPDLLLLDEPTNHLDIEGIIWFEKLMKQWKRSIICVSHDKVFIENVFESVMEMGLNGLQRYRAKYDEFLRIKEHEHNVTEAKRDQMAGRMEELRMFIAQNRFDPMKGAMVRRKRRELENLSLPPQEGRFSFEGCNFEVKPYHSPVMRVADFSFGYGDQRLGHIPQIEVGPNDRWAVMGPNGAGKTTMIRTMLGQQPPLKGEAIIPQAVKVGYLSQILTASGEGKTLAALIEEATGKRIEDAMKYLPAIGLRFDDAQKKWGEFSGGEKVKVGIVILILNASQFLVLDEPTNHLDLRSKNNLAEILRLYNGAVIIASHDREFLASTTENALVIDEGVVSRMTTEGAIRSLEAKWMS